MTAEAREAGAPEDPAADGLRPLHIALLTYKGNPFCGGQGVYVRHLSRELARLGHRVEVIGAQPYPVLDEGYDGLSLTELPSLDLYRQPDPFRTPKRDEYRDWIDALEVATMWTGGFPEPLTFSLRARRHLRARRGEFDVVHDNQTLGYGLLGDVGAPLVTTIHHPITVDRQLELDAAEGWKRRLSVRRWYGFTRMQKRVARRLPSVLTVSGTSQQEIVDHLGVRQDRIHVVHIGADTDLFSPDPSVPVVPGRIVTTSSADVPLKGLVHLVEALAKARTEHPGAHLVVVGKRPAEGPVAQAMERYGLDGAVEFVKGISDEELVDLVRSAQVACVPSLYEGFSLPAAEAMATGTPLLATTGGAIPEVAGRDGETCLAVPPGDSEALAAGLVRLLGDPELRARLGAAGRERVLRHFTWARAAEGTVARYREAIARAGGDTEGRPVPRASGGAEAGDDRLTSLASGVFASPASAGSATGTGDSAHPASAGSAAGVSGGSAVDGDRSASRASGGSPRGVDGSAPLDSGGSTSLASGGSAAPAGAVPAATTDVEGVNSESRATC
ncbi:putative D-inositol 3-phosphate glycosyltransferase [Streptomyces afghaniensis 772]|uniref:Putative D-inositol 3-phosphate glycosyltransferase n=1 Tax=Streptomyces afghaniensis 772 TaxID=1283301 RepID=S4MH66_9ACTN|nr:MULTISPECIES: glycosyltransferase family 4 protein [Streptomyces]EPJ35861.1 putative D-inositol 3-phosphate glycosyltransferase [Streptomyces afghaniensis 772]UOB13260.1 glycosyltransferase [Streptomyces sp. HP-A2021]